MKNILILILSLFTLASCEKSEVSTPAVIENNSITSKYNLNWSCEKLGVKLEQMKPSEVKVYERFNNANRTNEPYQERIVFENTDRSIYIEFVYDYNKGVQSSRGRILDKPFSMNVGTSKINIQKGEQNISIEYDLFSN